MVLQSFLILAVLQRPSSKATFMPWKDGRNPQAWTWTC
uniref:ATP synthase protein 8 n=1 Tax=Bursaphelenchus xylophilus TaxID=6326 RepID=A0A1I7SP58_BURXY